MAAQTSHPHAPDHCLQTPPGSIQTIIFDLGKVIVDFDHMAICRRLAQFCQHTPENIHTSIFASGLEADFDCGLISPEKFFGTAADNLTLTLDIERFKNAWNTIFTLNRGTEQIIRQLKPRYRLLCLSNTNLWQFEYCRQQYPVLKLFNEFILSYEVGQRKPEPEIYHQALQTAEAPAESCLYIDDIREYVDTAQRLGLQARRFTSAATLADDLRALNILT
ncbi:MAG: HAD family phosphatase [Deltaproteobacteria bacterium]|nr:HAD family phosphatase [Deltaproteobacteria bacterium]